MAILRTTGWVMAAVVLGLLGCKTAPEIVPSSGPRMPTSPESVKLYQKQPLRYERLGVVSLPVGPDAKWDARGNADRGFDRLKEMAAQRGANGLLLMVDRPEYDGRVLVGYHDEFYQVPMKNNPRAAVAEAIYVIHE